MKLSDGLFHKIFDEIATEYPAIRSEHQIIDIGAARVAAMPERLDVIVTLNLYGDILSDIAAQVSGSIGLAGSANIGEDAAMFEAVHGSAPDIAGRGVANPSGLLNGAIQMLVHLGLGSYAETIKNAWLCTLEDGIHTADVYRVGLSEQQATTDAFTDAIIARLGQKPDHMEAASYQNHPIEVTRRIFAPQRKELVGVDVFLDWDKENRNPNILGKQLETLGTAGLPFTMLSNRGVGVYPEGLPETFCTDHWRARFLAENGTISFNDILDLLKRVNEAGLEVIKTEHLYTFDGNLGFSLGQGE
jgi:isocitrate dehydrogenase